MEIGHCISHVEVSTLDITKLSHACEKSIDVLRDGRNILSATTQPADQRPRPGNLAARHKRPCGCGPADQRDELPSLHGAPLPAEATSYHVFTESYPVFTDHGGWKRRDGVMLRSSRRR